MVVFTEQDGKWYAYTGPEAGALKNFERGKGYWIYAASNLAWKLPDFTHNLSKGWNLPAWISPTGPVNSAIQSYEEIIPVATGFDAQLQKWAVYISSGVLPLTELKKGQTYHTFVQVPEGQGSVSFKMGSGQVSLGMLESWVWDPT